jgi:outer membrane usher protein
VLVQVPDTPGVSFYNQFGSTTNAHGDLLVSYMTPWRVNRVTADSFSLPESAHLDVDELETVPATALSSGYAFRPTVRRPIL